MVTRLLIDRQRPPWTARNAGRLLTTLWLSFASTLCWAQSRPPVVQDVEAAYLYQFGRYVDWAPDLRPESEPFFICVLGADPFGDALDEIVRGKTVTDRQVAVKRIVGPTEAQHCRILFVSPSEDSRVPAILKSLEGTGILTVGEGTRFTQRGGMIGFTAEERKVRFVVNLAAAEAAKLRLSSQLLRVAVRVEK